MPQPVLTGEPPPLPDTPAIRRKIVLGWGQGVGVAILLLIPLLALLGVFDAKREIASSRQGGLKLEVSFPSRVRDRLVAPLTAHVTNEGSAVLEKAELQVSRACLAGFAEVDSQPAPDSLDQDAFLYDLGPLAPGETKTVAISFRAHHLGLRPCFARVEGEGGRVEVPFNTWVWP